MSSSVHDRLFVNCNSVVKVHDCVEVLFLETLETYEYVYTHYCMLLLPAKRLVKQTRRVMSLASLCEAVQTTL